MPVNGVYKILIVDDSVSIVTLIQQIFSRRPQFSTIVAYDAETAITLIGLEDPDVVLLDLSLPQIDGIKACRQIKKAHPLLPILVITGELGRFSSEQAHEAGADDFISKPFNNEQLVSHVKHYLHLTSLNVT